MVSNEVTAGYGRLTAPSVPHGLRTGSVPLVPATTHSESTMDFDNERDTLSHLFDPWEAPHHSVTTPPSEPWLDFEIPSKPPSFEMPEFGFHDPFSSVISTLSDGDLKMMLGDFVIAPNRLTIARTLIAVGCTSKIFSAKLDEGSATSRDVAVKELTRNGRKHNPLKRAKIGQALKAWGGLKHRNVLEFLGCSVGINTQGEIYRLISPYMIHGNIRQYLDQARPGIPQRLNFVHGVTAGLNHLHSQVPPVCHGDLNPLKILVDNNHNAVLGGFEPVELYDDPWTSFDNPRFMSPESVVGEGLACKTPGDVWSWGCCAYEILTKQQPFNQHERNGSVLCSIIKRCAPGRPEMLLELVPDAPEPNDATTLRLLCSYLHICWEYEPQKRPPISLLHRQISMFSFVGDPGDSVVATLEELAHLLIPPDRLRIVERSELGAGNYGEVVLGILDEASPTPKDVAVKRLKAVGTRGDRVRLAKRLARELNVWAKIRHPNVVELVGYYLDEKSESPLLISALMTNGDVLKYMETFKPDIQQRIAFVKGITAGLECLHNFDPAIFHGDLKPANVLIDLRMNAVLCDFGLASFIGDSASVPGLATTTTLKGTPRYMSPELYLEADCKHSLESDVWAWACTVFQVLTGSFPYVESLGDAQICMAIVNKRPPGDVNLLLPNKFEDAGPESALTLQYLHSTLPQCWDFEPQLRPCTRTLLSQISNLSIERVPPACRNEEIESNASMEGTSLPLASRNPSEVHADSGDGAQGAAGGVAVLNGLASENLRKRKRAGSSSSGDTGVNGDARRVRTRLEGGSDGRMKGEEDEKRAEANALKSQLLALVAAIDEGEQASEGQISHETPTLVRGLKQALGDKWESQLATVLQNFNRDKKSAGKSDGPKTSEEGPA